MLYIVVVIIWWSDILLFSSIVHSVVDSYIFLVAYILSILARLFPCLYVNCLSSLFDSRHPSISLCSLVVLVQLSLTRLLSLCGGDLSRASVTKLKSPVIIRLFGFFYRFYVFFYLIYGFYFSFFVVWHIYIHYCIILFIFSYFYG